MAKPSLVDNITVTEDVGREFPVHKKVILQLWSDGTVTWVPRRPRSQSDLAQYSPDYYVGDE